MRKRPTAKQLAARDQNFTLKRLSAFRASAPALFPNPATVIGLIDQRVREIKTEQMRQKE